MAVLPLWTGSTTVAAEAGVEVAAAAIESVASAVNAANVEIGIGKNVARPTQMNETGAAGA